MQRKMTEYQNALSDMSNEAVEYVRGIPVVKTFGQTVFSFKKFKGNDRQLREVDDVVYARYARTDDAVYAGDKQRFSLS